MNCTKCFNAQLGYCTGEINQNAYLDCICGVADERVALNEAMKNLEYMILQDEYFHAYRLGKAAAIAEILPMLRKMWGHAIELGETDYFDDEQFEKEQYRQDCIEAAKLIAACK